jgi:hypothetical protein
MEDNMFFLRKNSKIDQKTATKSAIDKMIYFFEDLGKNEDFPLSISIDLFQKLDSAATSKEQLIQFCLEDIIFSSLYATIYEELIITCKDNSDVAISLIDKFLDGSEEREQKIAIQTQLHIDFLENGGRCNGCSCCDNHNDVIDLLTPYNNLDIGFFIQLYIGMQTIQITFEQLIYDFAPKDLSIFNNVDRDDILKFREYIYSYTEQELRS